ncbi:hypothetical protein MCOR27_006993 [Pyricularia oryzae]|uniref:Cyclochlorotine biosynthesis protein O n=5 Tax=Pyricularia TaxID=48558 RepID=A0ABQ8NUX2_PYRGI|nr:uncharacterized protein MGG_08831 [Pyricularia oryzae 70-15]ELQ42160.1 hypothetical protein OOU_Y34scaffold00228g51 [Pyricularia oryzae Y34]KAH8837232.1 hypothetical protein MCOR01_010868 [Pyricularia oryzae]KAI6301968.1 hypothetical protein MCOR33_002590 [Pyricularia grisea]EHA54043.1 hypothetical protein MGG_08831 [Pyricularia oryzae 70-15]KAH9438104.1 hypothetical protein MCOR02_001745 [Pyricularia oryzae]
MSKVYHSVPSDEERSSVDAEKSMLTFRRERGSVAGLLEKARAHWAWIGHAVLLSTSLTLFTLSLCRRGPQLTDRTVTENYSSYSPVAPIVKYETVRYNLTPIVEGPYVGFGEEVDKAWERITLDMGDTWMTEEEVKRLGLPLDSLKLKHPKTGKEGYRAAVEVFHQLHCLNLIRQAIYKDYYKDLKGDVGEAESPEDLTGHVDHCIETLRMNLMCQSDIGMFTFRLYPEYGYADDDYWPDFSTLHTCRNFEDIRQWAIDNTASWDHNV